MARKGTWMAVRLLAAVLGTAASATAEQSENPFAEPTEEVVADAPEGSLELDLRFAMRVNLFHKSWEAGGDRNAARFDTIMIGTDGAWGEGFFSWQYRFYDGYNMLHHAYAGYRFDEDVEVQFGVHQKPFGLLPYASHNWFFSLGYYIGLEDDYDFGAKWIFDLEPWELQFAYYFRDEGNYYGESIDSARYTYDIVETDASELGSAGVTTRRANQERNQLNARLVCTIEHGDVGGTELGISGEWGQIRNKMTSRSGDHWALGAHLDGNYDRFNVQLQATRFTNHPENPPGQDERFVVRGAYDAPYKVASDGWLFIANVAYELPLDVPVFETVTVYTDYSYLLKDESGFSDSQQLVIGASFATGPALIYLDFAFGRNHPWLGPDYASALAEGDPDAGWELRVNLNVGFYF